MLSSRMPTDSSPKGDTMNKAKLKSYAPKARTAFIAAVCERARYFGLSEDESCEIKYSGEVALIEGRTFSKNIGKEVENLQKKVSEQGFLQVMEYAAYTWFNRFCAMRFMELHGYFEHGMRVLSGVDADDPQILRNAADVQLSGLDREEVLKLKIANKDEELYRQIILTQSKALEKTFPFMFTSLASHLELLLPDGLLRSDSIIRELCDPKNIDEADWQEVEILGWLYQFYISEKKDQVIGKVVKSEDIPAATQLFTPNWIVKYMVQNSLGRKWLLARPDSNLQEKAKMEYYITPVKQEPEVEAKLRSLYYKPDLNPEELTLIDPACGSGHILVEAYDLFKAIYLECGYQVHEVPRLILEKNLYGLDIDERAAQLACFSLLMKAAKDDTNILYGDKVALNVMALVENEKWEVGRGGTKVDNFRGGSQILVIRQLALEGVICDLEDILYPEEGLSTVLNFTLQLEGDDEEGWDSEEEEEFYFDSDVLMPCLNELQEAFIDAKTFGSLILFSDDFKANFQMLSDFIEYCQSKDLGLYAGKLARHFKPLLKQARLLIGEYDCVVANPPYSGSKYANPKLKSFMNENYKGYEKDLFSAFMVRNLEFASTSGCLGFMTPFVWMFISSYENLRQTLIEHHGITSLVQLEYSGFAEATVPICTFTLQKPHLQDFKGSFIRLSDFKGADVQAPKTLEAIQNPDCGWFFTAKPDDFKKIPGSPVAYWVSKCLIKVFETGGTIREHGIKSATGLQTGDNNRFIRMWFEVSNIDVGSKWRYLNDGGPVRKWYGNLLSTILWEGDGAEIKAHKSSVIRNSQFYFKKGATWNRISSSFFSVRFLPEGLIFDQAGDSLFTDDEDNLFLFLGFLNSPIGYSIMQILCPTLNATAGSIEQFPFSILSDELKAEVSANVQTLVELTRIDWDSFEVSWAFKSNPLLCYTGGQTVMASYQDLVNESKNRLFQVQTLETKNNKIFIQAVELENELSVSSPIHQVTLSCNSDFRYPDSSSRQISAEQREKFISSDTLWELVSYIVGCTMGRYSLDQEGLVYANSGNIGFSELQDKETYKTFPPTEAGILPVMDTDWFEEDATNRVCEFIKTVWGEEHYQENLDFVAESLCLYVIKPKNGEQSVETIRRFLSNDFFKYHCKMYKKRPIYWLFSSGKEKAFQALVYLHRYNESTLSIMRTKYVIPLMGKLNSNIEHIKQKIESTSSASSQKALQKALQKEGEKLSKQALELARFDEKLRHYADQKISLDLDDGVKVNYGKFGDLLVDVKGITGKKKD
jgi:type II restriction/modification system DNA methylase subunit YeeA